MNAGKNITTLIKALPDPLLIIQPTKTAVEKKTSSARRITGMLYPRILIVVPAQ